MYFRDDEKTNHFRLRNTSMIHELVVACMLGLIGGMIPGPVITAVFTEVLQSGYFKSLRIILIALVTESIVAVISLVILASLGFNEAFFRGLSLAGAAILIWISISIWKVKTLDTGEKVHFGFWKIILMILSNGVLWTYWITICIPKAILLGTQIHLGEYLFMAIVLISRFKIPLPDSPWPSEIYQDGGRFSIVFSATLLFQTYPWYTSGICPKMNNRGSRRGFIKTTKLFSQFKRSKINLSGLCKCNCSGGLRDISNSICFLLIRATWFGTIIIS